MPRTCPWFLVYHYVNSWTLHLHFNLLYLFQLCKKSWEKFYNLTCHFLYPLSCFPIIIGETFKSCFFLVLHKSFIQGLCFTKILFENFWQSLINYRFPRSTSSNNFIRFCIVLCRLLYSTSNGYTVPCECLSWPNSHWDKASLMPFVCIRSRVHTTWP